MLSPVQGKQNSMCLSVGVSRGQLQSLQLNLSKWAAMASLMCNSRQWWMYEALLADLSQQAAAGVRPELLKLMNIPSMTAANARSGLAPGMGCCCILCVHDEIMSNHWLPVYLVC